VWRHVPAQALLQLGTVWTGAICLLLCEYTLCWRGLEPAGWLDCTLYVLHFRGLTRVSRKGMLHATYICAV
jgi:hypothetical protein